jgi:hypothetical protein
VRRPVRQHRSAGEVADCDDAARSCASACRL